MGKTKEEVVEVEELVKGINADLEAKATEIVIAGVQAGKPADEIKQAVFGLGVPFSKLGRLFNAILKKEGLSVDTKALNATIGDLIKQSEFTFEETLAELKDFADKVVENVPNATQTRVMAQLRSYWKLNETQFPRKAAPVRGRIGAINKVVIDTFKANMATSMAELETALEPATKNAAGYAKSLYPLAYALANGLSALEVLTVIAKEKE